MEAIKTRLFLGIQMIKLSVIGSLMIGVGLLTTGQLASALVCLNASVKNYYSI